MARLPGGGAAAAAATRSICGGGAGFNGTAVTADGPARSKPRRGATGTVPVDGGKALTGGGKALIGGG